MEAGEIPWRKPWNTPQCKYISETVEIDPGSVAWSRATGHAYSLLNQFLLGKPGEYLTFKQVSDEGGKVRKGEKPGIVCFYTNHERTRENEDGSTETTNFPVLRYYSVFHIDQCEGLEPKRKPVEVLRRPIYDSIDAPAWDPCEEAEHLLMDYLEREHISLIADQISDRAFYSPTYDRIVLPMKEQFRDRAEYYSTYAHEAGHSTGHAKRLDRFAHGVIQNFGSEEYSKEELVAEIVSASLCNLLGIETANSFTNSAAYIQSWVKVLKNDSKMIVSAAAKAEKAVKLILGPRAVEA